MKYNLLMTKQHKL